MAKVDRAPRGRGPSCVVFVFLAVLFASLPTGACREPRQDPESGRIRLLFLGWVVYPQDVTRHYQLDPLLDLVGVPLARRMVELGYIGQDAARRSARMYMPRTYERFVSDFDVVFLEAMDADLVTPTWNLWMSKGVVEEGLGLCMTGGWASFGGYSFQGYLPWGATSVGGILPVECLTDQLSSEVVIWMAPLDPEEPLMHSLPWDSAPPLFGINYVRPLPGSKTVANARGSLAQGDWPLLSYWDPGMGRVSCFMSSWLPSWGVDFVRWAYAPDFSSYLVYHASGLALPEGPELAHAIRLRLTMYKEALDGLLKLVDLVDRNGVSVRSVLEKTAPLDDLNREAMALYRSQEYAASLETAEEALAGIHDLESLAIDLKNRAFLWIYLAEWLSVTSVGMISGTVLWALMVRRKRYHPVAATRF